MLYGLLIGVILGANHVGLATAIPVLLGLVCLKGLAEIVFRRSWVTGGPSPYGYYLEQLAKAGAVSSRAWVGYLAQVVLFGTLIGGVGYVVAHILF
jgi:hypothetical protein